MRHEVARDLSESAKAFQFCIWPELSSFFGGEAVHVESVSANGFDKQLDTLAGIDAWNVHPARGHIFGLASRAQPSPCPLSIPSFPANTFTIRMQRDTGSLTEYAKRIDAISAGALFPTWTVHGYYFKKKGAYRFLSAMACKTLPLYRLCQECIELDAHSDQFCEPTKREWPPTQGMWGFNRADNADFAWLSFSFVKRNISRGDWQLFCSQDYRRLFAHWQSRKQAAA